MDVNGNLTPNQTILTGKMEKMDRSRRLLFPVYSVLSSDLAFALILDR